MENTQQAAAPLAVMIFRMIDGSDVIAYVESADLGGTFNVREARRIIFTPTVNEAGQVSVNIDITKLHPLQIINPQLDPLPKIMLDKVAFYFSHAVLPESVVQLYQQTVLQENAALIQQIQAAQAEAERVSNELTLTGSSPAVYEDAERQTALERVAERMQQPDMSADALQDRLTKSAEWEAANPDVTAYAGTPIDHNVPTIPAGPASLSDELLETKSDFADEQLQVQAPDTRPSECDPQ